MYNVVTSFGNYPSNIALDYPGPFTAEELGLKWLAHCARFSKKEMLAKYRLILLLPRDIVIPHSYDPYLDAWGERVRFDENSRVNAWPLGPNLVMQQVLWLYHYKKLSGPFLWCEPDCIPVRATWLDDLFEEYVNAAKPFMGAFVDAKTESGQSIPRHMTGNAIYPHEAYKLAPAMLEARLTPWDVFAAKQIMRSCHYTKQIQHEYRHGEIMTRAEMDKVVNPGSALFHTDKFGAIIRLLSGEGIEAEPHQSNVAALAHPKTLVEVFPEQEPDLDTMLSVISTMCGLSQETKKKVAYYMIENQIVVPGHMAHYLKLKKQAKEKKQEKRVETLQSITGEVAS